MKFLPYNPEQAYWLPPRVADVLGEGHLCFFLCRVVERLDMSPFEQDYEDEGRRAYAPALTWESDQLSQTLPMISSFSSLR